MTFRLMIAFALLGIGFACIMVSSALFYEHGRGAAGETGEMATHSTAPPIPTGMHMTGLYLPSHSAPYLVQHNGETYIAVDHYQPGKDGGQVRIDTTMQQIREIQERREADVQPLRGGDAF